ncbi:MAG: hypothetical protein ACI8QF_002321, partial [Limisphaerales bacterium]
MKRLSPRPLQSVFYSAALAVLLTACADQPEAPSSPAPAAQTEPAAASEKAPAPVDPEAAPSSAASAEMDESARVAAAPAPAPTKRQWTELELHEALHAKNPKYTGQGQFRIEGGLVLVAVLANCGIEDLSPLAGMPLVQLDLQGNPIRDISALKGAILMKLFL